MATLPSSLTHQMLTAEKHIFMFNHHLFPISQKKPDIFVIGYVLNFSYYYLRTYPPLSLGYYVIFWMFMGSISFTFCFWIFSKSLLHLHVHSFRAPTKERKKILRYKNIMRKSCQRKSIMLPSQHGPSNKDMLETVL